jgi:hypothetical protein
MGQRWKLRLIKLEHEFRPESGDIWFAANATNQPYQRFWYADKDCLAVK